MKTSLDHLMDIPAVKQWLYLAEQRMQDVFARSNFYNQLAVAYLEHGAYGTGTLAIFEDPKTVINCVAYTIGSYRIANNAKMRVDTFYRWYKWTVRQIVLEFVGDPAELNEEEFNAWLADDAVWANVSGSIRTQFAVGQYENWIDLKQCIEQRAVRDPSRRDNKNQPVASYYYELGGNPDQLLEESGYHEFPIMVFRWAVNAEDVYGNGPCGDCLGDAKALMLQQKRKAQAIDKMVDPPTVASPKLRQQRVNMLPGSVVYFDETAGKSGVRPIYEVKPDAQLLLEDIKETQDRIRKVCFEDVFQLLSNMEATPQKTAVEIQALMQEKMLMMGPVLELLNDELLNPAVDRVFNILMRKTLQGEEDGFPPVPQELSNIDLRIEFISILAQAQKAVATGAIQQLVGFALQLAQAHQEVLDAINFDEIIDSYADAVGTAPKLLNPQDQRDQVRQQRQQQQQQQQKIAMAEQASKAVGNVAGGAQSLANSPAGGGNALENILGINPSGGGP